MELGLSRAEAIAQIMDMLGVWICPACQTANDKLRVACRKCGVPRDHAV